MLVCHRKESVTLEMNYKGSPSQRMKAVVATKKMILVVLPRSTAVRSANRRPHSPLPPAGSLQASQRAADPATGVGTVVATTTAMGHTISTVGRSHYHIIVMMTLAAISLGAALDQDTGRLHTDHQGDRTQQVLMALQTIADTAAGEVIQMTVIIVSIVTVLEAAQNAPVDLRMTLTIKAKNTDPKDVHTHLQRMTTV